MAQGRIIYWCARHGLYRFLRIWNRYDVRGVEHVPRTGGCLLAANHASYLDPPAVSCGLLFRDVYFLARDSLFLGSPWLFRAIRCIPLNRDQGEVAALRQSIRVLRGGGALGLFPEGTRSPDGRMQPARGGVGFIIQKAGVPVVPILVQGTYAAYPKGARWVRPHKVTATYGPPIPPETFAAFGRGRDAHIKIGELVMARIAALADGRPAGKTEPEGD